MSKPVDYRPMLFEDGSEDGAETTQDALATRSMPLWGSKIAVQTTLRGSGAIAAHIAVEVSVNSAVLGWVLAATLELEGDDEVTGGATIDSGWAEVRQRVVEGTLSGSPTIQSGASGWAA